MQATINGIRMNYDVSGAEGAPVVVLHHPLATNLTMWDELTPVLAGKYRVVRFDARGHGQTEAPKGPYTFETLAADVVALMDHLKIKQGGLPRPVDGRHGRPVPRPAACGPILHPAAGLHQQPRPGRGEALVGRSRDGGAREGHGLAGGAGDGALDHGGEPQEAGAGGAPDAR